MSNEELIALLIESQRSTDSQLGQLIETVDRLTGKVDLMAEKVNRVMDSMTEWHEDRQQMHKNMLSLIERQQASFELMDKFAADAEARSKEADARIARLEKLFERSIERGPNGQH